MTAQTRSEALPRSGFGINDPRRFANNMIRLVEEAGKGADNWHR
jgi:hypothetical protein